MVISWAITKACLTAWAQQLQALSDISTLNRSMFMGYNPDQPESCLFFKSDICQFRNVIIQNNKIKEMCVGVGGARTQSGA